MTFPLRIIVTGGTIDDLEYVSPEDAPSSNNSSIPGLLKKYRIQAPVEVEVLMFKDSRHINDADRESMLRRCKEVPERHIVITHGTMTLAETAAYLGRNDPDKTVVLVGAMILPSEQGSDASFNLGYAIACAQNLPPGVYIAMQGKAFAWNNVRKNVEKGIFEEVRK